MRVIASLEELKALVGQEVAVSDWAEITQERVDQFAHATDDQQWIHIDVERSAKESPFGGTVAHGFLTLSLLPMLMANAVSMPDVENGRQLRLEQGALSVASAGRQPPARAHDAGDCGRHCWRRASDLAGDD